MLPPPRPSSPPPSRPLPLKHYVNNYMVAPAKGKPFHPLPSSPPHSYTASIPFTTDPSIAYRSAWRTSSLMACPSMSSPNICSEKHFGYVVTVSETYTIFPFCRGSALFHNITSLGDYHFFTLTSNHLSFPPLSDIRQPVVPDPLHGIHSQAIS